MAWPVCTTAGVRSPIPEWQCSSLCQRKNPRQKSSHAKCGQQLRDGLRWHGCATVAVDRHLITADALLDERLANHFCGGMLELVASFADLLIGVEDTLHRSDGTEICALIQQFRVGFGRCLAQRNKCTAVSPIAMLMESYMQPGRLPPPQLIGTS